MADGLCCELGIIDSQDSFAVHLLCNVAGIGLHAAAQNPYITYVAEQGPIAV